MTDKRIEKINELKEELDSTLGEYSALAYRSKYDTDDEDATYITVTIEFREKDHAKIMFKVKDDDIKIHKYEDVYDDLSPENIWATLFFSTL